MDYPTALGYILSFADYERLPRSAVVFDLRRVELLLERLGNPHQSAPAVHVAGTKGKGSTAAMIVAMLAGAGYRVGCYTSPHLLGFTERIRVNDQLIPEGDFARLTAAMEPEVAAVNREGSHGTLTTFELLTALAFLYFREKRVDYQVMETGLGGRLDATNVIRPEVAVLTSISYDHTDVLGDTLTKIATEKAGIIKPGSTVVSAPQFPEAMAVIERVCREKGVRLVAVDRRSWQRTGADLEGQTFRLKGQRGSYEFTIPLLGEHQMENTAVAVAAVESLVERGALVSPEAMARGLAGLHWPGRLQVLRRDPLVVIDGAHNAYSIKRLVAALKEYFRYRRLLVIFGVSADKPFRDMVAELAPSVAEVIVVRSRNPRSLSAETMAQEFARYGTAVAMAGSVAAAVELAQSHAGADDLICATGSIFIIAEVMEHLGKSA